MSHWLTFLARIGGINLAVSELALLTATAVAATPTARAGAAFAGTGRTASGSETTLFIMVRTLLIDLHHVYYEGRTLASLMGVDFAVGKFTRGASSR